MAMTAHRSTSPTASGSLPRRPVEIRPARPDEYTTLGQLAVDVYASLPGMPSIEDQPEYYGMLANVARRASNPAFRVLAAVDESGELLGCVDFITDMAHYGSGGTAGQIPNAAGIRLLAVRPECRSHGVGNALTQFCIKRARALGKSQVILHTTKAMEVAWGMYERIGFQRLPDIDFQQGALAVFGFRLDLTARA